MELTWENDAVISVKQDGKTVQISANLAGLRSLASHLAALAQEPPGSHVHLDEYNALEDGSSELIIEITA